MPTALLQRQQERCAEVCSTVAHRGAHAIGESAGGRVWGGQRHSLGRSPASASLALPWRYAPASSADGPAASTAAGSKYLPPRRARPAPPPAAGLPPPPARRGPPARDRPRCPSGPPLSTRLTASTTSITCNTQHHRTPPSRSQPIAPQHATSCVLGAGADLNLGAAGRPKLDQLLPCQALRRQPCLTTGNASKHWVIPCREMPVPF